MTKSSYLLFALAILLWTACSCPPNEKIGELSLTESAQDFLPYDGSEQLTFVDETGTSITLVATDGRVVQSDQLCTRTTCTEASYGSPSSCEYYAAESRRYTFGNEEKSIVIDLLLYTEVYQRGDATFYDALQAAFSVNGPSIVGHHLIKGRFDDPINLSNINQTDFLTPVASVTLNDDLYEDVLFYEEGSLAVYLKEGVGIIGFKDANSNWVLQP